MIIEEVKSAPNLSRRQVTKTNEAKEVTKTIINQSYVSSRQMLREIFNVRENDYFESIPIIFNEFIKPFRNTFSSLNAGVWTLYEILHHDREAMMDDMKLFIIFLEIYGTGRAVKPDGEYVTVKERRQNSIK